MENLPILASAGNPGNKLQVVKAYADRLASGELTVLDIGTALSLDPQQTQFATLYLDRNKSGDTAAGVAAEIYGYDLMKPKERQAAASQASYLLRHQGVIMLMSVLLDQLGLNDAWVDTHLLYVIEQKEDLKASVAAMKLYADIKSRIKTVHEIQHIAPTFDFGVFSKDELAAFIALAERARIRSEDVKDLKLLE